MTDQPFWPEDLTDNLPIAPIVVLRQACLGLANATSGLLEAQLVTTSEAGKIFHTIVIVAPTLGFSTSIAKFRHGVALYPVIMEPGARPLRNVEELKVQLRELFASTRVTSTVRGLLATINETK